MLEVIRVAFSNVQDDSCDFHILKGYLNEKRTEKTAKQIIFRFFFFFKSTKIKSSFKKHYFDIYFVIFIHILRCSNSEINISLKYHFSIVINHNTIIR